MKEVIIMLIVGGLASLVGFFKGLNVAMKRQFYERPLPEKMLGADLIFISRIHRDGSGTSEMTSENMHLYDNDYFTINGLSMTNKTYIATGMTCFVVKLKTKPSAE